MGYTVTEKIFNAHVPGKKVRAGDFVYARIDRALANDVTAPIAIDQFRKMGRPRVFNRQAVVLVPDHFTPAKDIRSAEQAKQMREFARQQRIPHYFEIGRMGIEHALLPELGLVQPGDLIVGADSHTCTYGALGAFSTGVGSTDLAAGWATGKCWFKVPASIKFVYRGRLRKWVSGKDLILFTIGRIGVDGALYQAMEFSGPVIQRLQMDDRFSMANMAIEAGGKSGIIVPDATTWDYVCRHPRPDRGRRLTRQFMARLTSDPDAQYARVEEIDVANLEPQVAAPHLPSNTKPVSAFSRVRLDQVVIGSCTNGRISDLRVAAKLLNGRKVNSQVRCIIFPATQAIYRQALKEGLLDVFVKSQAVVSTPTCGPCLGGHMGILAKGERALATTNRNFVGRMGHPESEIYLSGPAVAAASAVAGRIIHPDAL